MPYADRAQQREYQRAWKAERRAVWLKEHGPCAKCGSWEKLEVDHVDPTKKVDHKVWTWSEERRSKEFGEMPAALRAVPPGEDPADASKDGPRTRSDVPEVRVSVF
jgi:5-methylcytosine-specific restriction endonuclease McrA